MGNSYQGNKAMWSFSQLLSKFDKFRKGAGGISSGDPSPSSDESDVSSTADYSAALAASRGFWATDREPAARLDEELTIQAMYKSWVELESSVARAHDDLRTILANRERAATLRRESEQVLLEAEAIREEARHIGESAWQAFDWGFAINPRALASQSARLKEVEEAMKTQAALQRASHRETWDESDKTRQKATADLLKVLMALRTASVQVERELHEAANLPAVAESLKESARDELRSAEAIRNELGFLGQEALNLLGTDPSKGDRSREGLPASGLERPPLRPEERQVAFAPAPAETLRLEDRTPVYPAQEPQELLPGAEEGVEATTSVAWESVETESDRAGNVDRGAAPQPHPVIEREEPEENILPEIPQQTVQQPEATRTGASQALPPRVIDMPSENPATTAAEELRREIETICHSGPTAQDVPPSVRDAPSEEFDVSVAATEPPESLPSGAAQELLRELEGLRHPDHAPESRASSAAAELTNELAALTRLGPSDATASEEAPPPIGIEPRPPRLDQGEATLGPADPPGHAPAVASDHSGPAALEETPTPDPAGPLPQSYSGRFFLMFPASLSQDSLETVWEFLEEIMGPGTIVDMRLVSRDAGVQFTMELGARELGMDELRRRIPNAELVPIGIDRLKVNWSG